MTFKVGDKVKVLPDITECNNGFVDTMQELWGQIVTIESISEGGTIKIEEDSHKWGWSEKQFELVSNVNKAMANLNELTKEQKLAFSKDQQALYQVGITDSCGNINSTQAIKDLVRVNRKALVEQAQADIAEIEEAEKIERRGRPRNGDTA